MYRYWLNFIYEENDNKDSKNYIICAGIVKKELNGADDLCKTYFSFITDRELTFIELARIVKYRWEETVSKCCGSYNGFYYSDLRPDSYRVEVSVVHSNDIYSEESGYYENFPIRAIFDSHYAFPKVRVVKDYGFRTVKDAINFVYKVGNV